MTHVIVRAICESSGTCRPRDGGRQVPSNCRCYFLTGIAGFLAVSAGSFDARTWAHSMSVVTFSHAVLSALEMALKVQ